MNIFVGNLSFEATEVDLYKIFNEFGSISSLSIVKEKKGVKSRGFGFVEMSDENQGKAAIAALDGREFMGRPLNVNPSFSKAKVQKQDINPVLKRSGGYKGGRRTRSFIQRAAKEAPGVSVPWKSKAWRKDQEQSKPWRRIGGQAKPWEKAGASAKPSQFRLKAKKRAGGYKK